MRDLAALVSRRHLVIASAAVAAAVFVSASLVPAGNTRTTVLVEIEIESSRDGAAELTVDYGRGFAASPEAVAGVGAGSRVLRFRIGGVPERLRLLPFRGPGSGAVNAIRIWDQDERAFHQLPLLPINLNQIATLQRGDGLRFVTTDAAVEPYIDLVARSGAGSWREQLRTVTPAKAMIAGLALVALIGAGVFCVFQRAMTLTGASPERRRQVAVGLAAVALLVVGGKLAIARAYATQIPFLDAWSGEAIATFLPFGWGRLEWRDLFAAHYEHRILLTRVLDLFLLNVNGQWDELVHTVVNALLHSAAIGVLVLLLWSHNGGRRLDLLCIAAIVICTLPFGWQNSLAGFQSGFYLLLITLLVPLALIPGSSPRAAGWWIGMLLLALGLFSLASGILSVGAVAVSVLLARIVLGERRGWMASIAGCVILAVIGLWARVPVPPWHVPAMARTPAQFLTLTFAQLAFPHVENAWTAPLAWAPFLALGSWIVWRRRYPGRLEILLLSLAGWVAVQAAASGYTRGAVVSIPPSRYLDVFSLGILLNVTALGALAAGFTTRRAKRLLAAGAVVWCAWIVTGLAERSREALPDMALRRTWDQRYIENMSRYLADGNTAPIAKLAYPWDLPFDNGSVLVNIVLSDPAFRERLPPPLRDPLPLSVAAGGDTFVAGGAYPYTPTNPMRPSRGSFTARGNESQGEFRSEPMQCRHGQFMSLDVAGYLGRAGTELALVGAEGGIGKRVEPAIAGESWRRSFVRCPAGAFEIVARDKTPEWWFAFRPPIETGTLSVAAVVLTERWWIFVALGAGLAWLAVRLAQTVPSLRVPETTLHN